MKILLLTTHLNAGGITSYIYNLVKGFVAGGHDVYLVSAGGTRQDDFTRVGARLTTFAIRTKSELDPRIYWALKHLTRLVKDDQIDVIHAQTRITQVMGYLLGRLTHKPYVATCHGFFKPRLSRMLMPCWGQTVIAISPAVKEHLREDFHVPPERIALIRNGIDIREFKPLPEADKQRKRKELGIPPGVPVIGVIARLSAEKGHTTLIRAMTEIVRSLPQARLLIVGEGRLENDLKRQVSGHGLEQNVLFFRTVNRTAEILALLDVFVLPSTQEGLGLSVMEAQAAGLAVVASRVGGLPDLIEPGRTGLLFEPGDHRALAQGILELLNRRDFAGEIGRRARKFITEDCSYLRTAVKTLEVYERLVRKA